MYLHYRNIYRIAYANDSTNGDFHCKRTGAYNGMSLSELFAGNLRLQK